MRKSFERVEAFRISGRIGQRYGAFALVYRGQRLRVIASTGGGWDHVSVSTAHRCPTWDETSHVKKLFFYPDETVMQLHVPEAQHINCHPHCLHLWRPQTDREILAERAEWEADGESWPYDDMQSPGQIPLPPSEFVGPSDVLVATPPDHPMTPAPQTTQPQPQER